ncbi:hypothetical protein HZS_2688, partial [Henneguya salminicola]
MFSSVDHHTNQYSWSFPVYRRGFPISISCSCDDCDRINSISVILKAGRAQRGNSTKEIKVSMGFEVNGWTVRYESTNKLSMILVNLNSPPTAIIGYYFANIFINGRVRKSTKFLLFFNPWCKDDSVYLEDSQKRWEYIINTHTIIYMGTHVRMNPRGWYLAQFQQYCIEALLMILDRMPAEDRSSPIRVSRFLSAMVNANDDNGIVVGSWSGSYGGGINPVAWNGSGNILAKYAKYRAPVKYGQCWVFCGVLCTGTNIFLQKKVLRTCGIPARCVTTYNSFHDHDGSLAWEMYFNRFLRPVHFRRQETMWNFHCWNEGWMDRKDLPPGHGGWQIIDSTPQERSQGYFRCGPASQVAVKEGNVDLLYDTGFVFAEVNADKIFYYQQPNGGFRIARIDHHIVGRSISCKSVGLNTREDITSSYKYPDNSQAEKLIQSKIQSRRRRYREISKSPVRVEIFSPQYVTWKADCVINFKMTNFSNTTVKTKGRVNSTLLNQMYETIIGANMEKPFQEILKAYQLKKAISNELSLIKVDLVGLVNERDFLHAEAIFEIDTPKINIYGAPSILYIGKKYRLNISVANPLDRSLTNVKLYLNGDILINGREKISVGKIESQGSFEGYFEVISKMNQADSNELFPTSLETGKTDINKLSKSPQNNNANDNESNHLQIDDNVNEESRKHSDNQYPVSWLPAMVVSSENHGQYLMDSSRDKISSDMMAPGTFVQLPPYSVSSNGKLYGLVVGPNTVVPLDSLSLVNFPGFGKLGSNNSLNSTSDQVELGENLQNIVKGDGADGDVPHDGVSTDMHYSNIANDSNAQKDNPFCIYCQKYFKNFNDLQNHILIDHNDTTSISYIGDTSNMHPSLRTCPGCGHQLRKVGTFDPDFSMTASNPDEDQNINLTQATSILMVCDNCCKEFTLGLAPDTINQPIHTEPSKRFFCEHCDKSYKHNRDLRKHLRTHHGIDIAPQPPNQSSTTYSSTTTSNQMGFTQEAQPQSTKMTCKQCKKNFRGPFELRRHIHTVHENKRPYKCPECSKLFRDAYELKRHSASHQRLHFHTVANPSASTEGSSSVDMLRLQNLGGERGNQSQNIGQMVSGGVIRDVFTVQSGTTYGHPSSGGSVDYYCSVCEKNFRGANEFKRHYSVVHEKKYRYKCIHCGKLWRDQYDLKRHCRRSHFVDRDIDRAFIRQCLLENNNENSVSVQNPIPHSTYDINQHVTLTLNQEAATALFGTSDQEIRDSSSQLDQTFTLVDHNNMAMTRSPTGSMFPNISSIQPASMLYHASSDANAAAHLVENIIQHQDQDEAINEETKNAVSWSNFESDIQ